MRVTWLLAGTSVRAMAAVLLIGARAASAQPGSDDFYSDVDLAETAALVGGSLTAGPAEKAVPAPATAAVPPEPAVAPKVATVPSFHAVKADVRSDPLSVDALLEKGLKPGDTTGTTLPRDRLAPEVAKPDAPRPPGSRKAEGLDPEPDAAIAPPSAAPSNDPLDKPKPDAATTAPDKAAAQDDPLPSLNAALKAALDKRATLEIRGPQAGERRKERDAIAFFYAAHGFAPVWSEDGKPVAAVDSLLARLARAGDDALTLPSPPKDIKVTGTSEEIVASELAMTDAVVSYARQATGSRVDPRTISPLIGSRPDLADPAEVLDVLAGAGTDAGDKLQALNPVEARYVALREKLGDMHQAPTARTTIPDGPTLRIGMHDRRVPLIRSRFNLDADLADDETSYDTQVAEAVAGFQRANGLPVSGRLDRRTISVLSGGRPSRLEAALAANMEMWRWMPRDLGAERIEVNIPDYTVSVFHDGVAVAHNRVVVGKTETPTPLFSNTMKYLIVNPVWNVPESIIKKEFLVKGGGDLSYLSGRGFDVTYRDGHAVVKQPSGEKNALGRIKFIFPNDFSVYLHDTPSKSLFAASKRAFSHGCVRVDQPFDFAESVLNDGIPEGGRKLWSQKRLSSLLGPKERYVNLPKPLPIHIEYFTADVEEGTGRLRLKDDIYDYTRKVAAALGQAG